MLYVSSISADRWIWIAGEDSFDEPSEFVEFVKEYQAHLSGEIYKVSNDMQYGIDNDPLNLIFQWDSNFGITVIVPEETDISTAENALREICNKLNQKKN